MKTKTFIIASLILAAATLMAFGGVKFVKTWANPEAEPSSWQGKKVAVFARTLMNPNRELAEKAMVRELAQRGVQGVLGYKMVPPAAEKDRDGVKRILSEKGITGAVVFRIAGFNEETVVTSAQTYYAGAAYSSFYGYWGSGVPVGFLPGTIDQKRTFMVECLVFSLDQDKLVWAGTSKVVNPNEVDELIKKLAGSIGSELRKAGLVKK